MLKICPPVRSNSLQNPKPHVYLESLRNSESEKILLLRRNPLSIPNMDYVQMMLELSQEQGFEVTYFDIGKFSFFPPRKYIFTYFPSLCSDPNFPDQPLLSLLHIVIKTKMQLVILLMNCEVCGEEHKVIATSVLKN